MFYILEYSDFGQNYVNDFLKKYKKTSYISTSSSKKLNKSDLKVKSLEYIENTIDFFLEFARNGDTHVLNDLLRSFYDEFNIIISDKTDIFFLLYLEGLPYVSGLYDSPRVFIHKLERNNETYEQESSLMSEIKFLNREEILKDVIDTFYSSCEIVIKSMEKDIETPNDRNKKDYWKKMKINDLNRLKSNRGLEKIKIIPSIILSFGHHEINDYTGNDPYNYRKINYDTEKEMTSLLYEVFNSYLSFLGYSDLGLKIERSNRFSYYSDDILFKISFNPQFKSSYQT